MEWSGHVVCMRDGMGRTCGLYERCNGQGMWFVREMEWAGHEVCKRDGMGGLYERWNGQGMWSV